MSSARLQPALLIAAATTCCEGFNGTVNYSGVYQDNISGPGAVFAAAGWAYTSAAGALAGQNAAWIEVTFRDATANVFALYRSGLITSNAIANGDFPKNGMAQTWSGNWKNSKTTSMKIVSIKD